MQARRYWGVERFRGRRRQHSDQIYHESRRPGQYGLGERDGRSLLCLSGLQEFRKDSALEILCIPGAAAAEVAAGGTGASPVSFPKVAYSIEEIYLNASGKKEEDRTG